MRRRVWWKVVWRHEEALRVFSDARMTGWVVCVSVNDGCIELFEDQG